jgi:N-methylhydantoinase A
MTHSWRIGVDIGGTFTDVVLLRDDGLVEARKVPSTPDDYSRGIAEALRALLEELRAAPAQVAGIVHATTVATNTILEFKGARTGLLTTAGFRDVLEMRRLRIPVLYDLQYEKPPPLVPRRLRLEARERLGPDGAVRVPLSEADVVAAAQAFAEAGVEAVAVSFLHAYANPAHEDAAAAILRRELGDAVHVCTGAGILPEIREYERTSTAVVNAYVSPVVAGYAASLQSRLAALGLDCPVEMMQSGGGLAPIAAAVRRAAALVESGPAAGVIACARLARARGIPDVISFDMGGTTAKAALVEGGEPARTPEYEVGAGINLSSKLVKGGGYPIRLPFIDVSEIGAGGGSIVAVDRTGRVSIGPESAGAYPGPVCYGLGGTRATLTEAFLALGYINPQGIAGGSLRLDAEAGRAALRDQVASPLGLALDAAARGVLDLAVTTMTRAVKAVTTYQGRDPRGMTLVAFGGNGPVVAAEVARALGIRRVLVPPAAGVFSAYGLLRSDPEQEFARPVMQLADAVGPGGLARLMAALEAEARRGADRPGRAEARFSADLRYLGQAYELTLPIGPDADPAALAEAFHAEHERTYGHRSLRDPVQLVTLRVALRWPLPGGAQRFAPERMLERRDRRLVFDGGGASVPVIGRAALDGTERRGPFVVEEADATCIVPPWARARHGEDGTIEITLEAA